MRGRKGIVALLTMLALSVLTLTPALAVPVGPHDVTFVTQRYDYPHDGQSTWFYKVTSNVALSGELGCYNRVVKHVVLQLGGCCGVLEAGEWVDFDTLLPWTSGITVGQDYSTGLFGIKFDKPFQAGDTRNYYFVVSGNYPIEDDKIKVGIRTVQVYGSEDESPDLGEELEAAPYTYEALVEGPNLLCENTTAVTLSSFSATSPSGSLTPVALISGALLGMLVPGILVLTRRLRRQEA